MAYRRTPAVQSRLDATRETIVAAAVDLLAEGGWAAVTIAGVARRAGVATGTVYRHVADKDELCVEAFRRAAGHELEMVRRATTSVGPGTAPRVAAGLRTFAARALAGPGLAHALLAEPAGPAVEVERLAHRTGYRAVFADVLRTGVDRGELLEHDVDVVAAALVGAAGETLVGPTAPAESVEAPGDTDALVDELVAFALRALPIAVATAGTGRLADAPGPVASASVTALQPAPIRSPS